MGLGTGGIVKGLTKKERHQLVLDDELQIEQEIAVIKRVFAKYVHMMHTRRIQTCSLSMRCECVAEM
jgi:hypothetical protein